MRQDTPIIIGISSCLLGENVRYDGQNKYDGYIVETLGRIVSFLPICPETGIGLGVPRLPVRLLDRNGHICAIGIDNPDIDITGALNDFGRKQAAMLSAICGYIFKSRSPSCGLTDTPIVIDSNETKGPGLYARQIIAAIPLLPVTDEVSLKGKNTGDNFIERVFAFNRWQQLMERPLSTARLGVFHTLHRHELKRHHADMVNKLSDFLHSVENPVTEITAAIYLERFMAALETPAASTMQAGELFEEHTLLSATLENQVQ